MNRFNKIAFLLALVLFLGTSAASASSVLRVQGRNFLDSQNRAVLLRGVNVAGNSKVPPYIPITNLSQLDPLAAWGMNVIRLLFTWEAYETSPGVYNQAYLNQITAIADRAWARGMYVIVDFHQDGFSRYLSGGCGDGFPLWAVSPDATPDTPDNGPGCADWGIKMSLDPDMHLSFSDFYADEYGVRTRFLILWQMLANHFKTHPGVIGYDIINEPWGWEGAELAPLYEDAAAVIRAVDPSAILFIEGHVSTNGGAIQTTLPKPSFSNFAFAPHFYDAGVLSTKIYSGIGTATDLAFWNMNNKASEWNVPLFLGEFGAFATTWNGNAYMDLQYQKLNESLASGTQWNYTPGWTPTAKDGWNAEDLSIVDNNGNIRGEIFQVRPYAQKVSGTPTQLTVTEAGLFSSNSVELKWNHTPSTGSTVVFAPKQVMFGSTPVKIETSGVSCSYNGANTHVTCTSSSSGAKRVKVRPCTMIFGACF